MNYNIDYFIEKFEKIPEELWHVGSEINSFNPAQKCAIGHCGGYDSEETRALDRIVSKANMNSPSTGTLIFSIYYINDDKYNMLGFGLHPKERVINFLKSQKAVEEVNNILKQNLIYEETEVTV